MQLKSPSTLTLPRNRLTRYGVALAAAVLALLLTMLLTPITDRMPFLFSLFAVTFMALYVGLGPALLCVLISVLLADYYLLPPIDAFNLAPIDIVILGLFSAIAIAISILSDRLRQAQAATEAQRATLNVTLSSIGDGVIATDNQGVVTFMNSTAETLTGWSAADAQGQDVQRVFQIVNEQTRRNVDNPVIRVLREGVIVGLANHTLLIDKSGVERPIDDSGAPIRDEQGAVSGAVLIFRDIASRRRAENNLQFLADASALLASSLDYQTTLTSLTRLAVPRVADWCTVDMALPDGTFRTLAYAHKDPDKMKWAAEIQKKYPPDPNAITGIPQVIRSNKTEFYPFIPDEMLVAATNDPELLRIMREIRYTSVIIVPLTARGHTFGALQLVSAESGRRYDEHDVTLAEDLARRAAMAVDNARLFADAQAARDRAERAADRTNRLHMITAALGEPLLPDQVAKVIVDQCLTLISEAYGSYIALLSEDKQSLVTLYVSGYEHHRRSYEQNISLSATDMPIVNAVGTRQPIFLESKADWSALYPSFAADSPSESIANFPLISNERVWGALMISYPTLQVFNDEDRAFLLALSQQCAQALERAELRDAEIKARAQLSDILESITDAFTAIDADWRYTYANTQAEALFKRPRRELIGQYVWDVFQTEPDSFIMAPLRQAAAEQITVRYEVNSTFFGGWYSCRIYPTKDGVSCYFTDISERKRAEAEQQFLVEASALLMESLDETIVFDKLAHALVPQFADNCMVNTVDRDGRLRVVAAAARDSATEALIFEAGATDSPTFENMTVQPTLTFDQIGIIPEIDDTLTARYIRGSDHQAKMQQIGTRSLIRIPLNGRQGLIGVLSLGMAESGRRYSEKDRPFAEELARRAALALENTQLYHQAQNAIQLRDEFLSIAAHELKTPVTSLRGFAQLLLRQLDKRGAVEAAQLQRGLRTIDMQSGRLAELISQLLDVSRLEAGRLIVKTQAVDVTELVEGVVQSFRLRNPDHILTVRSPGPLMAEVDPMRLEQVLVNLLDNAIKYSPNGGDILAEVLPIRTGTFSISVTDHGVGIPEDKRAHIFDRFYQAHGEGYLGGMGLGLYISRQIIELHHGKLTVEFPPDASTRFVVTLPVTAQTKENADRQDSAA